MTATGFHHVAYACRDAEETRHFYEDLMGFPLLHTEMASFDDPTRGKGFMRHLFFDCGNGESIAFFDLHNAGETPGWKSEISTGVGLPVWVNHCAFGATAEQQIEAKARMAEEGVKPLMEIDHGWCHSVYFLDPNGIMVEFCRDTPGVPDEREAARALLTTVPD
jgi:catechol 2,3-dioxygenase-like lactoylglutathione lyase family enzyme